MNTLTYGHQGWAVIKTESPKTMLSLLILVSILEIIFIKENILPPFEYGQLTIQLKEIPLLLFTFSSFIVSNYFVARGVLISIIAYKEDPLHRAPFFLKSKNWLLSILTIDGLIDLLENILPEKIRDAAIGDLIEQDDYLESTGKSFSHRYRSIILSTVSLIWAMIVSRLSDRYGSETKVN